MDLLPTFAGLAGGQVPQDRKIDGLDVWPVLAGEKQSPHKYFFYHARDELRAVRSGDWKLHLGKGKPKELYDLSEDIGEKKNRLGQHSEIAEELLEAAKTFTKEVEANRRPAAFVEDAKPLSMQ